jgi:hypothetical protein
MAREVLGGSTVCVSLRFVVTGAGMHSHLFGLSAGSSIHGTAQAERITNNELVRALKTIHRHYAIMSKTIYIRKVSGVQCAWHQLSM